MIIMNTKIDLLEVALKKDIGIDLSKDELEVALKIDDEELSDILLLVHSSDFIDSVEKMMVHFIKESSDDNKDFVVSKCTDWLDLYPTNNEIKSNIKNLIKSC